MNHPFHWVDPSSMMISFSLLSFVAYFHYFKNVGMELIMSFLFLCFFLYSWFDDIIIMEPTYIVL